MAKYNNTLDALIERILKNIMPSGCWYEGECDASAVGTMVDATRYEADDFFQNTVPVSKVYIRTTTDAAAPIGELREITDWVQTGGTASVAPNWTAAPGAGDTYCILNEYLWDEVKGAINMAIDKAKEEGIRVEKIDHSVELASGVYEYTIPEGFTHLYRITMADGDGQYNDPVPADQWGIVRGMDTPRLKFYTFPEAQKFEDHYYGQPWAESDLTASRTLRIEGFGAQEHLDNDIDICKVSPEYICYQAAAYLHLPRIKRSDVDTDEHATQLSICQAKANDALPAARPKYPANIKRVES